MSVIGQYTIPPEAKGLRLYKIVGERLIACELIMFPGGASVVDMVLRRAAISGRVEINGKVENHFADIYVDDGTWTDSVALDARSYSALKNKWMRCKLEDAA